MKGFVYFISYPESRWVKIGYAKDVADRLQDLQCATPEVLTVEAVTPADPSHERQLHRSLRIVTKRRGEWYQRCPLVEDLIGEARQGFAAPFLVRWATARRARHLAAEEIIRSERSLACWTRIANDASELTYRRIFFRKMVAEAGEGGRLSPEAVAWAYEPAATPAIADSHGQEPVL